MSEKIVAPEIRFELGFSSGDLWFRDGYNIKVWDGPPPSRWSKDKTSGLLLEFQTNDIEELLIIVRTVDAFLKMLKEKGLEIHLSTQKMNQEDTS